MMLRHKIGVITSSSIFPRPVIASRLNTKANGIISRFYARIIGRSPWPVKNGLASSATLMQRSLQNGPERKRNSSLCPEFCFLEEFLIS